MALLYLLLFLLVVVLLVRRYYLPAIKSRILIPPTPYVPSSFSLEHTVGQPQRHTKKCLVTGASGFIGRYLVERLLEAKEYDLVVATDLEKPRYTHPKILNLALDVTHEPSVKHILESLTPHVVFHLAAIVDTRCGWPHRSLLRRVNVDATRTVVEASGRIKARVVSISSSSKYFSDSEYGRTKAEAENIILEAGGICIRPSKVYGLGDQLGTEHFLEPKNSVIFAANSSAGLCYVRNLAELLHMAAKNGISGTAYNAGEGFVTYREFADGLLGISPKITGNSKTPKSKEMPYPVAWALGHIIPWIDFFLSLSLGGRAAPLSPALLLNPVVLKLVELPKEWSREDVKKTPERLGLKQLPFANFEEALEDIRKLLPKTWEERLPLAYELSREEGEGGARLQILQPAFLTPRLKLPNRIVKAATFEGLATSEGIPTDDLIDFHAKISESGVGLTTVAYGSISKGGRSFPTQVVVSEASLPALRTLVDAVHAHGGRASLQLTHAGYFATVPLGPYWPMVDFMHWQVAKKATEEDLRKIVTEFGKAAEISERAGFDAVEVHAGHGYLLSQFLAPHMNTRDDKYGGNPKNRARLVMEVLQAVRKATSRVAVILKFNLADVGGPTGSHVLTERCDFILRVQKKNLADALVPSGGSIMDNGFFMLRGSAPVWQMAFSSTPPLLLRLSLFLFGWYVVPSLPYSEAFFADASAYLQARGVTLPIILTGGVHKIHTASWAPKNGFWGVGMARALLNDPNLVEHWKKLDGSKQTCDNNNTCVTRVTFSGKKMACLKLEW
jgi:2,4-dienoyl-CoA reductase-like NADH-dependent reductase (Old Yellow Enzyme family)/nucleoside-diphosphate-sugar epimerase